MTAKVVSHVSLLLELPGAFWTLSAAATPCWPFIYTRMYIFFLNFQEAKSDFQAIFRKTESKRRWQAEVVTQQSSHWSFYCHSILWLRGRSLFFCYMKSLTILLFFKVWVWHGKRSLHWRVVLIKASCWIPSPNQNHWPVLQVIFRQKATFSGPPNVVPFIGRFPDALNCQE